MIPYKLIPRPAGLHSVTLSCSSKSSAIPIQEAHLRRLAALFPPVCFPWVGIFIPGYFTALPWPSPSPIFHTVTTIQLLYASASSLSSLFFHTKKTGILPHSPSIFSFHTSSLRPVARPVCMHTLHISLSHFYFFLSFTFF